MQYGYLGKQRLLRLTTYNDIENLYDPFCMNGFEFTHHDVLTDDTQREKIERRVEHHFINHIHVYVFYTLNVWEGNNPDLLWARCDDDLLAQMMSDVKEY